MPPNAGRSRETVLEDPGDQLSRRGPALNAETASPPMHSAVGRDLQVSDVLLRGRWHGTAARRLPCRAVPRLRHLLEASVVVLGVGFWIGP